MICKYCGEPIIEGTHFTPEKEELNKNVEPCRCEGAKSAEKKHTSELASKTRSYVDNILKRIV